MNSMSYHNKVYILFNSLLLCGLNMEDCSLCGTTIDKAPHITCAKCGKTVCDPCAQNKDVCPSCGFKG